VDDTPAVAALLHLDLSDVDGRGFDGAFERREHAPGHVIITEGDEALDLFVLLEGRVLVRRGLLQIARLGPGDTFGEIGVVAARRRAASVHAETQVVVARLTRQRFEDLVRDRPAIAAAFLRQVVEHTRRRLVEVTDAVAWLLRERASVQRTDVEVRVDHRTCTVRAGTPAGHLLPERERDEAVVAAIMNGRAASLATPLLSAAELRPLTRDHWEGREVWRRSCGLLLLDAAAAVHPGLCVRIGPSLGFAHIVEIAGAHRGDLPQIGAALHAAMDERVVRDEPFIEERWSIEEARGRLQQQGWSDGARLLDTWRYDVVPVVGCGATYALALGPTLPSARHLGGYTLVPHGEDLLLRFGDEEHQSASTVDAAIRRGLARAHDEWLRAIGIDSVAAFNASCVSGQVSETIRVSEGFHEKRIGGIADEIAARRPAVQVITVAGPSSAGKTTFIKRLTVQLRVNGLRPRALSLDDYYLDRDKTRLDEHGHRDFEALEALDLELLADHLRRLLRAETVRTARFDFVAGLSHPGGGPEMRLGEHEVLLLEGIHGLNPRLPLPADAEVFRIFINPMSSLPLDRLNRVGASDLRLLRRVVRDRRHRGITAAEDIARWPRVRDGERRHIFPYQGRADAVFNTSLVYEPSVIKVYAERYLMEVPHDHPSYASALRLRQVIDHFVAIYPDHVPPTSILREFIGGSGFEY
jgi:uridine kinase